MTEAALFELLSLECLIDSDGNVHYHNAQGEFHRIYGPAVEYATGYRAWSQNGQLHRLDGPAVERPDGRHEWHINGKELTKAEWQQAVASVGIYAWFFV